MINNLEDFILKFNEIKNMGWIRTHRSGSTGIGKTLEDLLGIDENNIDGPDFADYELKSTRVNSGSMLTLFTKSPQPARSNTYLRLKYGYSSNAYDNDEKVLHSTLNAVRFVPISNTGKFLKVECDSDKIFIMSNEGPENVYWSRETLKKSFEKKYANKFIYVKAESRGSGSLEEFNFISAHEVSGFDYDSMIQLLEEGKIYVDLRIGQYPDGRTHDHGTGFRIREIDQYLLFKNKVQL
jgi:hypothetical protein